VNALELKVPPPAVAILMGVAMWFGAPYGPSGALSFPLRAAILAAFVLAGAATALAGDLAFRRARTTINPFRPQKTSALVTSGVYRFTRNPMYVGLLAVLVGWAAFLGAAVTLLGPVAFVAYITRFQIVPEERVLSAKFGAAYTAYAARVRRWL